MVDLPQLIEWWPLALAPLAWVKNPVVPGKWLKKNGSSKWVSRATPACCCPRGCCNNTINFPPSSPTPPYTGITILRATIEKVTNGTACLTSSDEGTFVDGVPHTANFWYFCLVTGEGASPPPPINTCLFPFRVGCIPHPVTGKDTLFLQFDPTLTGNCGTPASPGSCPAVDKDYYPTEENCCPFSFLFVVDFSSELVPPCDVYASAGTTVAIRITKAPGTVPDDGC